MITYLINDNLDCFYTAIFTAYEQKNLGAKITAVSFQPTFGEISLPILPSIEKSTRVQNSLLKIAGRTVLDDIKISLLSCDEQKHNKAFEYVKLILTEQKDVSTYFSHPAVMQFTELKNKVWLERHRFTGFLRFHETISGVLYAVYEPDNDVTEILAPFFKARLNKNPFIIHDIRRNKFALWSGIEMRYITTNEVPSIILSDKEVAVRELWKKYFAHVNIDERPHKKQQDSYLPRRYRKYMNEFF